MEAAFAIAQFWLAPVMTLMVSVVYFLASPRDQGLGERLAVSSAGCIIAAMYLGSLALFLSGGSRIEYGKPFAYALLVPLAFMVFAFIKFRGSRKVHWLQIANFAGLLWTFFIGSMAITGDWI